MAEMETRPKLERDLEINSDHVSEATLPTGTRDGEVPPGTRGTTRRQDRSNPNRKRALQTRSQTTATDYRSPSGPATRSERLDTVRHMADDREEETASERGVDDTERG